uniref:Uncharacterized protein n=1 Tax=Acrobeloides nanus TaxID=290746 RepID=A0A914EET9_9BILA
MELFFTLFLIVLFAIVEACLPQNMPTQNLMLPDSPPLPGFSSLPLPTPQILLNMGAPVSTPSPELIKDKLFGAPIAKSSDVCKGAYVIAITLTPYLTETISHNRVALQRNLKLLESFTRTRMASFGSYEEESINYEGFFAERYTLKNASDCEAMKEFTTKAVSFSEDVERAIFMCKCGEIIMISKVRN